MIQYDWYYFLLFCMEKSVLQMAIINGTNNDDDYD